MQAIKGFLQGKWLRHPLHPALVHLPTALWPAALFFDLFSQTDRGGVVPVQIAYYAILLGLVVAAAAAVTGLADWLDIKPEKPARKLGLAHMLLNLTAVALFALNLWLRAQLPAATVTLPLPHLGLTVLGNLLLAVSGYLGGRLVYQYGISVARHSEPKLRRRAEAAGAKVPAEEKG